MAERPSTAVNVPDSIGDIAAFGSALSNLRASAALTIRQVADKIGGGVSYTTLGGWFAGRGLPSLALRGALIDVLRVCGVEDEVELRRWLAAWERVRRAPGRRSSAVVPYRGLAAFETVDAEWFFGRRQLTSQLLTTLTRLSTDHGRIMLVTGASGVGKSSVLRAGLVPALPSGNWPDGPPTDVALMTPGSSPCSALADQTKSLKGPRPLLVIDQFEEIFTASADRAEQSRFVDALASFVDRPGGALVVIGLRADFYASILRFPRLRQAAQNWQVTVAAMEADELREAVEAPARKARLNVEAGFVEAVLHDLVPRGGRAILPLLSYALFSTWRAGSGRRLTIADYRATGGISGAVARSAEAAYAALAARQKALARRLFLALVHVDPNGADTRRRISRHELMATDDGAIADVVDQFVGQRLITTDADTVEISHEALLSAWPQLTTWLDENREQLLAGRQLARTASMWRQDGHLEDDLLRGTRLSAATQWAQDHPDDSSPAISAFLDASHRRERHRISRLHRTIGVLAALTLIAAVGGVSATAEWHAAAQLRTSAVDARNQALSRLVAVNADQLRGHDPSLAAQLAVAAYTIAPTVEARASLLTATGSPLAVRLIDPAGNGLVPSAAISPDGRTVAVPRDDTIRIWKVGGADKPTIVATLRPLLGQVWSSVAFSPAGLLVAGSTDGTIAAWTVMDPAHPTPVPSPPASSGPVFGLAFADEGRLLATTSGNDVRLWSTANGHLVPAAAPLAVTSGVTKSVALTRDGHTLAAGDASGVVTIWNITDRRRPEEVAVVQGSASEISQVALSPDGRTVASGARDGVVFVWSLDPAGRPRTAAQLAGAQSWINALAFSPDGTMLAAGSSDTSVGVRIWQISDLSAIATWPHPAPVTWVTFTADSTGVVSASNDGIVRIWPVRGPALSTAGVVSSAVFSPDGRTLAVGSTTTGMRLWNTTNPDQPSPYGPAVKGADSYAGSFAFSPSGRTLAVSYGDRRGLQLWDVSSPASPVALSPVLDSGEPLIESVAFSPDGHTLATAGNDGAVEIWAVGDPHRPLRLAVLTGFTSYVTWVTFSPNGRTLAASSNDKTVRLWDVADLTHPTQLGPPIVVGDHFVYCVAFSPDGYTMATSSGDSTIRLWDLHNRAHPVPIGSPLVGPTDYVYLLSFAADGHTIAAAVNDGTVWLWDVHDMLHPAAMAAIETPAAALYTVGYRGATSLIVAGGTGGLARLFYTDPVKAAAHICAVTGDQISVTEWNRYVPGDQYTPPCA